ncbi:hypothetical protein DPMN_109853 [Dreissena polymorpha]|uniref:Uncharacterized protein n=1 Tax=Dreissena polymorpha TaxID=45954 RepID=A0A9D4KB26_DREPO|nr:hypothetical protein DPMN_109853 [Dreissena polymorpha]
MANTLHPHKPSRTATWHAPKRNKRANMAQVSSPERSRFTQYLPNVKLHLDNVKKNILVKFDHYFICES